MSTLKGFKCKICGNIVANKGKKTTFLCRKCGYTKEVRQRMSQAKYGIIPWNKGIKNSTGFYWLGKSNKNIIIKHHVDANKKNNEESNFLYIKQGEHRSLHWKSYEYLVKAGLLYEYLQYFSLKYEIIDTKDKRDGKVLHHIDCDRNNNAESNFMYLKDKKIHNKLHQEAYNYLVRLNKVYDYIDWFFLMKRENNQIIEAKEELKKS